MLSPRPVERTANWKARVNAPVTTKELERTRVSIERGRPYGKEKWVRETVKDLGLELIVRPERRPRKASQSATEATSQLRGFHPAFRFANKPIVSCFHSPSVQIREQTNRGPVSLPREQTNRGPVSLPHLG
jgi:hypothetical protein